MAADRNHNAEERGQAGDDRNSKRSPVGPIPSLPRLIVATVLHHGRSNFAVALGVAAGVAVLTGALLVGDSMRGSLRHLALDRLGHVDYAVTTDRFFRAGLAGEWADAAKFSNDRCTIAAAILLQATLQNADPQSPRRADRVELIGCDEAFWQLGEGRPKVLPRSREVVLNRALAEQLGVRQGDVVVLRLPRLGAIPADSPLGNKRETVVSQRVTVSDIILDEGLGRFSLQSSQRASRNAYVPLEWLANQLGQSGRVNTMLIAGSDPQNGGPDQVKLLQETLHPTLDDYGLSVAATRRGYVQITSDRMVLSPAVETQIRDALASKHVPSQPSLTYLANTIAIGDRQIPYSTVTAIDFVAAAPLGPFVSLEGKTLPPLVAEEIALNAWAAENLHAAVGDTVQVTFFEPESVDGSVRERTVALRLAGIVRLSDAAADRDLTPKVKGITDELTMADWDPPFPFDTERVRPIDEQYWKDHGPTPKAFVSLDTGRRLWGSRFGCTTTLRIGSGGESGGWGLGVGDGGGGSNETDSAAVAADLVRGELVRSLDPAAMGFLVQPVKSQALAASTGTTPFGVLFISFSFFLLASAALLVAILFRLNVEQRVSEIGILLAIGWPQRKVGRLFLAEGFCVACLGSALGVPLGVGYAALMLLGLRTWWLAAVTTPMLRLYVTPASLGIGAFGGLAIATAVIWLSCRRIARISASRLLAGETSDLSVSGVASNTRRRHILSTWGLGLIAFAPAIVLLAVPMPDNVRAGAFFAVGATSLAALLALTWLRWKAGQTGAAVAAGRGNLLRMAVRNAARNAGRSTLTVGLVAAATFLIVAVSAFRVDPTQQTPRLAGGNGGFALVAESDQPIYQDLNTPAGRATQSFSPADETAMAGVTILGLRVQPGDDASCLNLYQSRRPRILGLPPQFIERGGFAWAARPRDCENPWKLLEQDLGRDADGVARVPVILEKNTANYALHLWGGLGETFDVLDSQQKPLRLQVVALLADSIFQGDLLIAEKAFLARFSEVSGYRFFLVAATDGSHTPTGPAHAAALLDPTNRIRQILERNLGDYGFAVETTGQRMAAFLAVQNTYLSTFQSLGGLGLLLGTFGLAAVQLRNVWQRRRELAVMQAAGFRRRTLAHLVLLENVVLLATGLGIGLFAAVLAVLPQTLGHGASIPWPSLFGTLAAVLLTGLLASGLAVRSAVRVPVLEAIRKDS
jgi:ABC-type lipoprotein release transport system permease subunit